VVYRTPGFIGLVTLMVVTQIVTAMGVGPGSLRSASIVDGHGWRGRRQRGFNNSAAATAPVAALAVLATLSWWRRAEAR
jgi:hypothetical protein